MIGKKKHAITIRITDRESNDLKSLAEIMDKRMSEVLRIALDEFVKQAFQRGRI